MGGPCTIVGGVPGTLQRQGDWMVCRPTSSASGDSAPAFASMDAARAEAIKAAAYAAMSKDGENAWKRLGSSA